MITPERVPRSVVLSQGTVLGCNGQSWSFPCYILDGHFPDAIPADEDPIPVDGNPHRIHGVPVINPNVAQHWHHDMAGAAHGVHMDVGLNAQHMQQVNEDLIAPMDDVADVWPAWMDDQVGDNAPEDQVPPVPQHPEQPQDSISFDQSGSTARYLQATGPDIVIRIEDVLAGNYGSSSNSSTSSSSGSEVQSLPCVAFQNVEEQAFKFLREPMPLHFTRPLPIGPVLLNPHAPDQNLAIVPYYPSLHDVLIRLWAEFQTSVTQDSSTPTDSQALSVVDEHDMSLAETLALTSVVSVNNPKAYLEDSSCRRSTRQSLNRRGFRHIQLEGHPRKRQCTWTEVPVKVSGHNLQC